MCATSVTINWIYDTNDADGYVVYYNNSVKNVEGGDIKNMALNGLMPGTSYSIKIRAYQDIIGPPSKALNVVTIKCNEG